MEKSTGGVSFGIRFIDSGNGSENCYSVKSRRLIGVYNGDWSLKKDGTVNASMVFARRVGDIRSHGNLIEKVCGIGENMARVSISECLGGVEGEKVELDGRLLNDPVSYGRISRVERFRPSFMSLTLLKIIKILKLLGLLCVLGLWLCAVRNCR